MCDFRRALLQRDHEFLAPAALIEVHDPDQGVAHVDDLLVEFAVLASVHGLLADEAGDPLLEHWVGDLIGVVAHGTDERLLAGRKRPGKERDQVTKDDVALDVVLLHGGRLTEPEVHPAHLGQCTRRHSPPSLLDNSHDGTPS
ncbi:Uncharacterised protein [Mycobacteroides abscessus subsp. abscessus]|nr:Uncharacterised protein [Mycobacteroides abscessus subsp. abscessus]